MPSRGKRWMFRWAAAGVLAVASSGAPGAQPFDFAQAKPFDFAQGKQVAPAPSGSEPPYRTLVRTYCVSCHNAKTKAGGLELASISTLDLREHPDAWEKVVRKVRARQMPPAAARQPDETLRMAAVGALETSLDALAAAEPNPGRTDTFRRLNRTEYRNAIRDLLAIEIDAAALLPSDSASFGFDNVTVGNLSPTLLESYVSAAEKISQLAVGRPSLSPGGSTVRLRPDLTQEGHLDGLPIGTRGGAVFSHVFPVNGEYEITIRLARDRNEHVEGLLEPHDVELLVDGERLRLFTVAPPSLTSGQSSADSASHATLDQHLKLRVPVTAGPHMIGVTFPKKPSLLLETARQPYEAHFNYYRHPRIQPAVYEVSVIGPYNPAGAGDTPSRRRIFTCSQAQDNCAKRILSTLMRRAYRRPVNDDDLKKPFELYAKVKAADGFDAGIEMGLSAVLASPEFLFRIERDPSFALRAAASAPERKATEGKPSVYRISDLELASRLSFFLWSSIPDDELLDVAARGDLDKPAVLERQVKRMLADPRSRNLVTNFAAQWLHLRNLESMTPDMRLFPDFDDNLRQALRQETEMLVDSVIRENRSVLDLLRANYTFVNERLAKHYGIPNIYGSRFRRIEFADDPASPKSGGEGATKAGARGGLLRQGSILLVTSY